MLAMTRKVPAETRTAAHENRVTAFIARATCMNFIPQQLHFFEETSVVKTAGNRKYGHTLQFYEYGNTR